MFIFITTIILTLMILSPVLYLVWKKKKYGHALDTNIKDVDWKRKVKFGILGFAAFLSLLIYFAIKQQPNIELNPTVSWMWFVVSVGVGGYASNELKKGFKK